MKCTKTHVLLFGDASASSHASLQALYKTTKGSTILHSYLVTASRSIDDALAGLHQPTSSCYKRSKTLLELSAEHESKGRKNTAVTFALTTATQLGWLILQMERGPLLLHDGTSERTLLGFCTGMLAAIAAAYAPAIDELLELAPRMVCVSFEVGLALARRSALVEATEESWARVVHGLEKEQIVGALDSFNVRKRVPLHRRAFVSAVFPSTVTVSAPPSTLDLLLEESPIILDACGVTIPSAQALHCPYMDLPPLNDILKQCPSPDKKLPARTRVISPSSGDCFAEGISLVEMLQLVLLEIFKRPIDWPAVQEKLVAQHQHSDVTLSTVSTTYATTLLTRCLRPSLVHSVADDHLRGTFQLQSHNMDHEDIAVVGMAIRLPGANDLDAFWDLLVEGRDMHKTIPPDRFDVNKYYDASGESMNSMRTPFGCFVDDIGLFDAPMFRMSPREAAQTDPSHRLLLLTAYEALERAGCQRDRTASSHHSRIGTFFGQTSDDYREANISQQIDGAFYTTGGDRAFGPGRLNYFFGWEGPSCSVDTACSSSLSAVQIACRALRARDCDTALAGGVNIMTSPAWFAGLSRGGFLSPTGGCKTWDEKADGYCRADGVGTVVLKRLGDAIADNDNVLGVIKAIGTNHSASASSITQPHAETQERLFREVLCQACVVPDQIDYVAAHGTGTQSGDVHELTALRNFFGKRHTRPLYIGSVKPNIGHSEASSGVASLVMALLMLREDMMPPHIGIKTLLNPNIPDLSSRGILIPQNPIPFPLETKVSRKRCILVNNFNATGGNTCLVLQEQPKSRAIVEDQRTSHVVVVSAKSPVSLEKNMKRLSQFLRARPAVRLQDVAYTTTARRTHHERRKAFAVGSIGDLVEALDSEGQSYEACEPVKRPRIVFTFTGQGATYAGMGHQLFIHFDVFRNTINDLTSICENLGLPSFVDIVTDPKSDTSSRDPAVLPLAIVALQLALANLWNSWGLKPDLVVGHSIGEYAALCTAGVISTTDLFYLLGHRMGLFKRHCASNTHGMIAISKSASSIQETISELALNSCSVACYNSPTMTVVSGLLEEIEFLRSSFSKAQQLSLKVLKVPFAYHSKQMEPILSECKAIAHTISYSKPSIPFISSLLGKLIVEEGTIDAGYMARQTREPVLFMQAAEACRTYLKEEPAIWIEIGPDSMCLPMVRTTLNTAKDRCLASILPGENIWTTLSTSLRKAFCNGVDVRWNEFHKPFEKALNLVDLPAYAFDLKSYWIPHEGSWMLHNNRLKVVDSSPARANPLLATIVLQRIVSETETDGKLMVEFESDIQESSMREIISGHIVNGRSVCPSAVFAEIAFDAAVYIWYRDHSAEVVPAIDMAQLNIIKPLILAPSGSEQMITISACRQIGTSSVEIIIYARHGSDTKQIASGTAIFGDSHAWMAEWSKRAYLFLTRMEHLTRVESSSKVHHFLGDMVYKTFSSFVQYDQRYRGIRRASADFELYEATASISFQVGAKHEGYKLSPYWIDNLAHLSGWILNASYLTPNDVVYLSHGWESMRIVGPLHGTSEYQAYVRMQAENDHGLMAGDVHVFADGATVAVFSGIKFQGIKRPLLERLFSDTSDSSSSLRHILSKDSRDDMSSQSAESSIFGPTAVATSTSTNKSSISDRFRSLLETNLAMQPDELQADTLFADLGIDSLLSLSILDTVRQQLGIEMSSSFFFDHPTFADVERYLEVEFNSPAMSNGTVETRDTKCLDSINGETTKQPPDPKSPRSPDPKLVRLHKGSNSKSAAEHTTNLFLLPDGSGSAASLAALPFASYAPAIDVIAFDSPFLSCPEQYSLPFVAAAELYVKAIIKAQPSGPYLLGGWSIGGIFAYEVACQLARLGNSITSLIFIDSPCPDHIPPIQTRTLRLIEQVGIFDSLKKTHENSGGIDSLVTHFAAGSRALAEYEPLPWAVTVGSAIPAPSCLSIVAEKGIIETVGNNHRRVLEQSISASDMAERWLIEPRPDGTGGWESLLGANVRYMTIHEADHFSIVRRPYASDLVAYMMEEMDDFV